MKRNIRIQRVSTWNIGITLIVAIIFMLVCMRGEKEFRILRSTTEDFIACEKATAQLQQASDYMTEQVRFYTMTGDRKYLDQYFAETEEDNQREAALQTLEEHFPNTSTVAALKSAMEHSENLSNLECYAMKLVTEATDPGDGTWPDQILQTELTAEEAALSADEKCSL